MTFLSIFPKRVFRSLAFEFRFPLNGWTLTGLALGLLVFLPMATVLWNLSNPPENWEHLKETVLGTYLMDSLILVAGTVLLSVLAGVSCAWLVTCCDFPGQKFLQWALVLPLAVPTFIAAYGYFDLLGIIEEKMIPLVIWARTQSPENLDNVIFLLDSLKYPVTILVMASVLYPYVYLLARASFFSQGSRLIEAARTLGYKPRSVFFRVALPLARPAIVAGASLVAMETLNDYGAVKHFGVSTFTIGIFRTWLGLDDLSGALRLASLLMLFILGLLVLERAPPGGSQVRRGKEWRAHLPTLPARPGRVGLGHPLLPCTPGLWVSFSSLAAWFMGIVNIRKNLGLDFFQTHFAQPFPGCNFRSRGCLDRNFPRLCREVLQEPLDSGLQPLGHSRLFRAGSRGGDGRTHRFRPNQPEPRGDPDRIPRHIGLCLPGPLLGRCMATH